jgi:hypothetical protein
MWALLQGKLPLEVSLLHELGSSDEKLTVFMMCILFYLYLYAIILQYWPQYLQPWHPLTTNHK